LVITLYVFDTAGFVIQTLAEKEPIRGVTALKNRLYLLRGNVSSHQIEVYDVCYSYRFLRYLNVPALGFAFDIAVCGCYHCAYISDTSNQCVHRAPLSGSRIARQWPVDDVPTGLSLTVKHTVLVTCREVVTIKEYTTHGELLREIELQEDVISPWHSPAV